MKKLIPNSMKNRILLAVLCAGIVPALVLVCLVLYYNSDVFSQSETDKIFNEATLLSKEIASSTYFEENGEIDTINLELSSVAEAYSGRIMVMDSSLKVVYDSYDIYVGRIFLWSSVVTSAQGKESAFYDDANNYVGVTVPIKVKDGEEESVVGVILMTESTDGLSASLIFIDKILLITMLAIIIVAVGYAVYTSTTFVKPYYDISDAIDNISHNEESGINVTNSIETKNISDSFNKYFEQMQTLDATRQEFVSNVSHELKTPLTSMKVLADSINSMGEGAPIEMYREFMGDIVGEIDRETKIINDLLSLVRMDKSRADLNIVTVNINELLEMLLKRLEPLATKQEVSLALETFRPVTAEVDEVKFTLAIMNLIENAIKYNNPGGWVHISVNSDHQYCYIRVEDNGLGIPEEDLDRVFERFFRADKSHSREIGGTGLGLAITYDAIVLHRGEIKVDSTLGDGTTFDVRIPLSYIDEGGE